ncbi:unnamed protein product [Pylaiella littoralis]
MGAQQSRRVDNDTSPGESDSSWMNRVQVKPSEILVARLQQASSSAEAQRSEPPALEEDHTEEQEERNQAVRREREGYLREVRMEEDDAKVRELVALKEAESAHLSKIISSAFSSAFIPSRAAGRQTAVCGKESRAVVQCYRSNRTAGDIPCGKLVDSLELCASNTSRNQ